MYEALLALLAGQNGWTLAEAAGDATPDGMQRLLNDVALGLVESSCWILGQATGVACSSYSMGVSIPRAE